MPLFLLNSRLGYHQQCITKTHVCPLLDSFLTSAGAARSAAAVATATESQAIDMDVASVGQGSLPTRDSTDSQPREKSPDAATALPSLMDLPLAPLRGTPVRGLDPTRAGTPPPRSATPPTSNLPNWGPADGIR